jgi:hypothetical protein
VIAAIMQPYFFPYIGYFQLMAAVDVFVFHDDVQYIKAGWVNRNRLLGENGPLWWSMPVVKADHTLSICDRHYQCSDKQVKSMLNQVDGLYRGAPQYRQTREILAGYFHQVPSQVSQFNAAHLQDIARRCGIPCRFLVSSEMAKDNSLKGQDRVIDICRRLGATRYINPIGGLALYEGATFDQAGIDLQFLQSRATSYPQFNNDHVPFLSIVDVMMFNDFPRVSAQLQNFDLIAGA